jgi:RNA polymerase sigma factor (sigma-70 family)
MTQTDSLAFTYDPTNDESIAEFEADEKFLAALPTDISLDSDTEIENEDVEDLILSFRRGGAAGDRARDDAYSYLQEIGKTPLLTQQEETELFQQFDAARQWVAELLDQLPPSILERVRFQSAAGRRAERNPKPGMWWSPMNIAPILEWIQKEIKAYQRALTVECTASDDDAEARSRLAQLWTALTDAAGQMHEAKMKIVEANLLLVASITKQHHFPQSSVSFLDLMQEGSIGLMKAVEKFDLQKGYRFSTYATWWIMQAITRARHQQSQTVRVPCYIGERQRAIKEATTKLEIDLERRPDLTEIAEAVDMPKDRVIEILQGTQRTVSLSAPLSESSPDTTISDLLADESQVTPEEEFMSRSEEELLDKVLGTLAAREALVIKLRFGLADGEEHTLCEIGRKLGVTRERARQIEVDALRKLRHSTRTEDLKELL